MIREFFVGTDILCQEVLDARLLYCTFFDFLLLVCFVVAWHAWLGLAYWHGHNAVIR